MTTYEKKIQKSDKLLKKREVRNFIISKFKHCHSVVGLAGPNIKEYINWCHENNMKNIIIYENDKNTFLTQIKDNKLPAKIVCGSINQAEPDKENTFYDLDYCSTIRKVREYIPKFHKNYSVTLSLRAIGAKKTIDQFFKSMKETIIHSKSFELPVKHTVFTTVKGETYIFTPYFDTSPMCSITKINYENN